MAGWADYRLSRQGIVTSRGPRRLWTTFGPDQIDLNYRSPDLLLAVLDVLLFLVSKGARLLRLDAVTFLWKEPGSSSANLPETHAIIKLIREVLPAAQNIFVELESIRA